MQNVSFLQENVNVPMVELDVQWLKFIAQFFIAHYGLSPL